MLCTPLMANSDQLLIKATEFVCTCKVPSDLFFARLMWWLPTSPFACIHWIAAQMRSACLAIMANRKVFSVVIAKKSVTHVQSLSPEIQQNEIELMLFLYVQLT